MSVVGLLLVALTGAALVSAGPALAGPAPSPAATITVTLGSRVIVGFAGSTAHSMTLRQKRAGSVIASKTFTTDPDGFFDVNLKAVKSGDRIVIQYLGTRTVTVPRVTLSANATTDRISGHVPAPGDADVQIADVVGTFSKGGTTHTFTTDGQGDFSGLHAGLQGADRLELRWQSSKGDATTVELALAAAEVEAGSSKVWLFGRPGAVVKADLLAADGSVRGRASAILEDYTAAQGTFRKNGTAVKVKAGDRVRIGGAVGLTVRAPDLDATPTTLTATCFPNQDWIAGTVFGTGAFSYVDDGTANGSGAVSGSWASPLTAGTRLRLLCENAKGYTQDMTITLQ